MEIMDLREQKLEGKLNGVAGVYLIICNGEVVYVGSSLNVFKRKSVHLADLRHGRHSVLQELYNEYGEESFVFTVMLQTILEEDHDKLYELEAKAMKMFADTILNKDKVVKKYKYIRNSEESKKFSEIMSARNSGQNNPNSKLTVEDVRAILDMKDRGVKFVEIADVYGVSPTQIGRIGVTRWKCVV